MTGAMLGVSCCDGTVLGVACRWHVVQRGLQVAWKPAWSAAGPTQAKVGIWRLGMPPFPGRAQICACHAAAQHASHLHLGAVDGCLAVGTARNPDFDGGGWAAAGTGWATAA